MKKILLFSFILLLLLKISHQEDRFIDDDEFEVFDTASEKELNENEFNDEEDAVVSEVIEGEEEEIEAESVIEDEDDHFANEEEFTGYDQEDSVEENQSKKDKEPKITVASLPLHLRSNWDSYYVEMLLLAGLIIYMTNFNYGRGRNQRLAALWFNANKQLLTKNFALVGDDGRAMTLASQDRGEAPPEEPPTPAPKKEKTKMKFKSTYDILKESESSYTVYCSGRVNVDSMMVELKLVKRQDLFSLAVNLFRPTNDEAIVRIQLRELDPFVLCFVSKKYNNKYAKEMNDITTFCRERKGFPWHQRLGEDGATWSVWSEVPEVATDLLSNSSAVATYLDGCLPHLNYCHVSDQFTGAKVQGEEQQASAPPAVAQKMLIMSVQITEDAESLRRCMALAFFLIDKVSDYKLSKEGKMKTMKNRSKMEKAFMKSAHAVRSERAQEKREEKQRLEREKMMEVEDPEKQRKWEERENKRMAKKKNPKVKQLRVNM